MGYWWECEKEGTLGRPRRRLVDNVKMGLTIRDIGWSGMDWIYLDDDRGRWRALVNTVMNLRVP
jgi:transposase